MDNLSLQITLSPDSKHIDFLTERINEDSKINNEPQQAYPFGIYLRRKSLVGESDKLKDIVAGCNGSVVYGVIYTDQLWVHPDYRGKGYGKFLMDQVHKMGRERKCSAATVGTMDFQNTKEFYKKLGYLVEFERAGYVHNSKMIYLKKEL